MPEKPHDAATHTLIDQRIPPRVTEASCQVFAGRFSWKSRGKPIFRPASGNSALAFALPTGDSTQCFGVYVKI